MMMCGSTDTMKLYLNMMKLMRQLFKNRNTIGTQTLTVCLVLEGKECVCDRDALLASLYDDGYDVDLGELGRVDSRKVYARHEPSDTYIRLDIELGLTEG